MLPECVTVGGGGASCRSPTRSTMEGAGAPPVPLAAGTAGAAFGVLLAGCRCATKAAVADEAKLGRVCSGGGLAVDKPSLSDSACDIMPAAFLRPSSPGTAGGDRSHGGTCDGGTQPGGRLLYWGL